MRVSLFVVALIGCAWLVDAGAQTSSGLGAQPAAARDSRTKPASVPAAPWSFMGLSSSTSGRRRGLFFDAGHSCAPAERCDQVRGAAVLTAPKFAGVSQFGKAQEEDAGAGLQFLPFRTPPAKETLHGLNLAESTFPCYTIRSYEFTPTDPKTGATTFAGASTCRPLASVHLRVIGKVLER